MDKKVKLGFTGDFSFSGYFQKAYKNDDTLSSEILDFLNGNDANIINYESPITACRMTKKARLSHRTDPEALEFVKNKINNPILSFANNHMMDYRSIGMIDTIENVRAEGIKFIGAGRNKEEAMTYEIVGDNLKVGIIAIEYKTLRKNRNTFMGPMSENLLKEFKPAVEELRKKVDWLVVVYHGGDEFLFAPMPYTRKLVKKFLRMGADVVVAHHPHVVQGYEYFGKKAVFYSLGNFMFDTDYQRAQEGVDSGMILNLTFDEEGFAFENMPIHIDVETHIVGRGEEDPHFCDIGKSKYGIMWTYEAMRKLDVLKKAADLKEREIEAKEEAGIAEQVRHEQLLLQAELFKAKKRKHDEMDESDLEGDDISGDNNDNGGAQENDAESRKVSMHTKIKRTLRKVYRKVIRDRDKNYKAFVLKMGRMKYRLLYRGKKVF